MAVIQVGNGWFNTQTQAYTIFNSSTGQLTTKFVNVDPRGVQDPNFIRRLQSGEIDITQFISGVGNESNYLGGRSNVNISGQIRRAADELLRKYPQMSWDSANKYALDWVNKRIAAGWDANVIEDMAKGALRDDKELGGEMFKGIEDMVVQDELKARNPNATGAELNPAEGGDGKGSIQDELREFAGRMMQTVGPDSPQAKRIAELAAAAGNKYATSSGMGPGGLTTRGVGATAARAHTDLQTQREGLGMQALAAAGNQQLSVDQLKTQLQAQNQQAGAMNAQGIGGLIGSGVGLVGGIIGTAYSGGSMAPAIPGLVQAGGAAGSAVGGIAGNQGPNIQYGGGQQRTSSYGGRNWGTS